MKMDGRQGQRLPGADYYREQAREAFRAAAGEAS